MTMSGNAIWDSLSSEMKHETDALAAGWQSCHARWTKHNMSASSPEVSSDDPTMEMGSDDDTASKPTLVLAETRVSAGALRRHHDGGGGACTGSYVGIRAGAGGAEASDRFNINSQLEHLQAKYVGTGHADLTRFEWAVNIQRDSYASYVGHYPMLAYFSIAENESIGRERYDFMQAFTDGMLKLVLLLLMKPLFAS
ncbi:hypothetical protein D1007_25915 [Hordeum vulgare]|nr:hypothetical protein D1007_25915 [Hordeum vulgare]